MSEPIIKDGKLIGYKAKSKRDGKFIIPVYDVRINRGLAEFAIKESNAVRGSKYLKPSFSLMGYSYNVSRKK